MKYIWLFFKTLLRLLLKPLSFLPALCMMYLIYSFSGQDGQSSAQLSYKVTHIMVEVVNEVADLDLSEAQVKAYIEKYHYYVRKLAHFTEYFLLGLSVAFPLYVYGMRGFWLILFAGAFCGGFASLDEYHQSFIAGRGPSRKDVLIDTCGAITGIYVTRILGFVGRKTIFAPLAKKKKR